MAHPHSRTRSQREVLDALADVVSVEPTGEVRSTRAPVYDSASASYSGQAPMATMDSVPAVPTKDPIDPLGPTSRSKRQGANGTGQQAPPPPAKSGFGRFANAFRRHNTDEKDAKRREKEKRMQRTIDESQSTRMDIIDRMDLSGLGASLFHHDSPYDACSPHSNRNSRRAPVNAFDNTIDPMTGLPIGQPRASGSRPGLSPLAQATMRKMSDNAGDVPDDGKGERLLSPGRSKSGLASQMPALGRNQTGTTYSSTAATPSSEVDSYDGAASNMSLGSNIDRDVDAERNYRNRGYYNAPNNVSRGRADVSNPNADVWGVTSEPWQDFAQPASNRRDASRRSSNDGIQSSASSVFDMEAVLTGKQPVRTGSNLADGAISPGGQSSGSASGSGNKDGPKRSKSLVKRIKYARQYGNVPPPDDDVVERAEALAASNANGKANGARRGYTHQHSPSSPPLQSQSPSLTQGTTMMQRSGTLRPNGNTADAAYTSGRNMNETQNGSSNLGRKGSVFGRFRGKSRDQRDVAVAR